MEALGPYTMADAWKYRQGHLAECPAANRLPSSHIKCGNGCEYRKFWRWIRLQFQSESDHDYMSPEELERNPV